MISILQLQYFQFLAREQHLTNAAAQLHVSQSTLSMMLKKMEDELGTPLFDRKNHRLLLNDYGAEYLKYVDSALDSLERGRQRIETLLHANSQKLAISVSHAQVWMDRILGFKKLYPSSYIALFAEDMHRYGEMICDYTLDFVISGIGDFEDDRIDSYVFSKVGIVACLPKDHPLAKRDGLYLRELDNVPYIDLSPGLPFRKYCDNLFEKAGATCNRYMECDYDIRRRLIAEGQGYALTPDADVTRVSYMNCAFVPIKDPVAVRDLALFWKKGRSFTPIMRAFYDYIKVTSQDHM